MSKLTVKTGSLAGREIELSPGLLHLGRADGNEIVIPEPSISSSHCELNVSPIGISVHDLGSTNGTFISGQRVTKGMLQNGDVLRVGDIDLAVELSEVTIEIPKIEVAEAAGAAFLEDGSPACFNHHHIAAVYRCTGCENWWCVECVRHLKRVSGDFLNFCPDCSAACAPLPREGSRRKKTLIQRIGETLRISAKH